MQEKQDLLCQAAKAMELMEGSQKESNDKSTTVIDLKQKIELLEVIYSTSQIDKVFFCYYKSLNIALFTLQSGSNSLHG